jgi:biotin carboxylase
MSRLMILGGSAAQLGAIRHAKASGHTVIVADRNPNAVGVAEADAYVRASTFVFSEVVEAARRTRPDGILVVATDQPVRVAARVCAELGLPSAIDPHTALLATHKGHMKRRLSDAGIPTSAFTLVVSGSTGDPAFHGCPDLGEMRAPFVVKPVDNQGQRGVSFCRTHADLAAAMKHAAAHSTEHAILVEEFYKATEITVSGWVTEGTPAILAVTDRVTLDNPPSLGVCAAHRFPSEYERGHEREIDELTRRVASAFGITAGPIYLQMLVGTGGVIVNEVACRVGGAFEDRSLPLVTGADITARAVSESLGLTLPPLTADDTLRLETTGAFSVPLLYCRPGTIAGVKPLERARAVGGVHEVEWLQPEGRRIDEMRDSSERTGYAVVHGPDPASVNHSVRALFRLLSVTSTSGEEMLMDTLPHCLHS